MMTAAANIYCCRPMIMWVTAPSLTWTLTMNQHVTADWTQAMWPCVPQLKGRAYITPQWGTFKMRLIGVIRTKTPLERLSPVCPLIDVGQATGRACSSSASHYLGTSYMLCVIFRSTPAKKYIQYMLIRSLATIQPEFVHIIMTGKHSVQRKDVFSEMPPTLHSFQARQSITFICKMFR